MQKNYLTSDHDTRIDKVYKNNTSAATLKNSVTWILSSSICKWIKKNSSRLPDAEVQLLKMTPRWAATFWSLNALPDCRSVAAVSVLLLQETGTKQSNEENRASRRATRKNGSRAMELHATAPDHRALPVLQSENATGVLDTNTSTDKSNTDQDRWKSQCARGPHLCAKNSTNRRLSTEKSEHQKYAETRSKLYDLFSNFA
jgi:hypothetical protein